MTSWLGSILYTIFPRGEEESDPLISGTYSFSEDSSQSKRSRQTQSRYQSHRPTTPTPSSYTINTENLDEQLRNPHEDQREKEREKEGGESESESSSEGFERGYKKTSILKKSSGEGGDSNKKAKKKVEFSADSKGCDDDLGDESIHRSIRSNMRRARGRRGSSYYSSSFSDNDDVDGMDLISSCVECCSCYYHD